MTFEGPAARGRHAPPPEVRVPLQRERLLQVRLGEPADILELAPVIDRLIEGLLGP
jgi:hypothetical protein